MSIPLFLRVALVLLISVAPAAGVFGEESFSGPDWIRDLEQGQAEAARTERDLLVVFTGHGWCFPCQKLDQEVFRERSFVEALQEDFVFVELDFTFGDSEEEQQREQALRALAKSYLVHGYPTVVLADAQGTPYAFTTGYDIGTGPQPLLVSIREAEKGRKAYARFKAQAGKAEGADRLALLDQALSSVAPHLEGIEMRQDDPLLVFYAEDLNAILADEGPEAAGLKSRYVARKAARDAWLQRESVLQTVSNEVRRLRREDNLPAAIELVQRHLEEMTDEELSRRLEGTLRTLQEWSDQHQEALATTRRMLATYSLSPEQRESLLDRIDYNFTQLKRLDDFQAHIDSRLEAAGDDAAARFRLLSHKAQLSLNFGDTKVSIPAWREFRAVTEEGTDDWYDATAILARLLMKKENFEEAKPLIMEFLRVDPSGAEGYVYEDAAQCFIGLRDFPSANKMLAKVEAVAARLRETGREGDRQNAEYMERRVREMRAEIPQESQAAN